MKFQCSAQEIGALIASTMAFDVALCFRLSIELDEDSPAVRDLALQASYLRISIEEDSVAEPRIWRAASFAAIGSGS